MSYKITFHYMDGQDAGIKVTKDQIKIFFEALNKGEVYFNPQTGQGVWIPLDKVRLFRMEDTEPVNKEEEKPKQTKAKRRGRPPGKNKKSSTKVEELPQQSNV